MDIFLRTHQWSHHSVTFFGALSFILHVWSSKFIYCMSNPILASTFWRTRTSTNYRAKRDTTAFRKGYRESCPQTVTQVRLREGMEKDKLGGKSLTLRYSSRKNLARWWVLKPIKGAQDLMGRPCCNLSAVLSHQQGAAAWSKCDLVKSVDSMWDCQLIMFSEAKHPRSLFSWLA